MTNTCSPSPVGTRSAPRPPRVLRRVDVPLGVRHQAQHPAGRVADACHVGHRAVGIVGKRQVGGRRQVSGRRQGAVGCPTIFLRQVTQHELSRRCQPCQGGRVAGDELAFPVRDGQIHRVDARQEDALRPLRPEPHPAILVLARVVVRERGRRAVRRLIVQQDARLDHHLEAVADAQDQFAGRFELAQRLGQVVPHLHRENLAGRHVVAEAESARNAQDLEAVQQTRVVQQAVDVQGFGLRSGGLEGEGGFVVAVRARGTEDQDGGGHCSFFFFFFFYYHLNGASTPREESPGRFPTRRHRRRRQPS